LYGCSRREQFAQVAWREACIAAERSSEMSLIAKPCLGGDLAQGSVGTAEEGNSSGD